VSNWRLVWFCATTGVVPLRALGVTVVVGTLLNLINQGNALLGHGAIDWVKLDVTYMIPYCVATSGATARLPAMRAPSADKRPAEQAR
jgi:hypothetical protein